MKYIDDFSRYGYIYLLHKKSQSLDMFKKFKTEVDNQLSKIIKSVRSDHVVSTMTDMMIKVSNVQDHNLNS